MKTILFMLLLFCAVVSVGARDGTIQQDNVVQLSAGPDVGFISYEAIVYNADNDVSQCSELITWSPLQSIVTSEMILCREVHYVTGELIVIMTNLTQYSKDITTQNKPTLDRHSLLNGLTDFG